MFQVGPLFTRTTSHWTSYQLNTYLLQRKKWTKDDVKDHDDRMIVVCVLLTKKGKPYTKFTRFFFANTNRRNKVIIMTFIILTKLSSFMLSSKCFHVQVLRKMLELFVLDCIQWNDIFITLYLNIKLSY